MKSSHLTSNSAWRAWLSDIVKPNRQQPDYGLLMLLGIILLFGLVVLTSASSVEAVQKYHSSLYFLRRQLLLGVLPGIVLLWLAVRTPYWWWKKIAVWAMVAAVLLLVASFIPGVGEAHRGVHSWINLGPLTFQPSELVKLMFVVYLARWLEGRREHQLRDWTVGMIPFLIILGILCTLLILQPDLGTMVVMVLIGISMFMLGGASFKHLLLLILGGAVCILLLVNLAPYRAARLTTFLHPEQDPQGIGYHVNQALLAIGSGGLWGRGLGQSVQKYNYLPEVQGDSIFAVMAEEFGFLLTAAFLFLWIWFLLKAWRVTLAAPDRFSQLVAGGIVSWLAWQSILNLGGMLRLVPLTGLPLPFVSYGGTAMAVNFLAVGVLLSISRYCRTSAAK